MKFQVQVTGEAALGLPEQDFELDASTGDAAVDAARKKLEKLAPKEGGALDIVVSALEPWERVSATKSGGKITESFPPGEVSSFSVLLEPHESVRAEVEAKRAAEAQAKREELRNALIESRLLERLKAQGLVDASVELSAVQAATGDVEVSQ